MLVTTEQLSQFLKVHAGQNRNLAFQQIARPQRKGEAVARNKPVDFRRNAADRFNPPIRRIVLVADAQDALPIDIIALDFKR